MDLDRVRASLSAEELRDLLTPLVRSIDVVPLLDAALWGKAITDERYALVGMI